MNELTIRGTLPLRGTLSPALLAFYTLLEPRSLGLSLVALSRM